MPTKSHGLSFSRVLKSNLRFDDEDWTFTVPGIPSARKLNQSGMIKSIAIQTDIPARKHSMLLKLEHVDPNRAIRRDPLDCFILFSLENFRPLARPGHNGSNQETQTAQSQPSTGREISDYSVRLLRSGVTLDGVLYNFYGHSNSQLKSQSCFLFAASKEHITQKIENLGDFSKLKTVAKKSKRIGLLFSAAQVAVVVPPDRCEDIPDVETPGYIFTDGCGLIAPILARDLARRVRILFRNSRYTPSVFQIRYRGYKGVVTVDPRMAKGSVHLKLRKSMKKFSGGDDESFSVVDYAKPFAYGYLNDETTILLHALGISEETLRQKQMQHFDLLSSAKRDYRAAFCFLSYLNKPDLAEAVFLEGVESVKPQITKLVNAEYAKMLNKKGEERCRIFVRKSRLLFGVCDAWDVLKEGECAVKVTMEGDGKPYALKGTEVSVIRNPCLHPGDWQKFRVVERPELSHLVDCIVFSVKGRRPAADLMSGGDLDGDQFFVCWDSDLIPSTLSQAAQYPGGREPVLFRPITDDDRLVYFARYTNASLGQVKNLYLDWARTRGPMSPQCQELNRLFSQCVDGNRIRIPEKLREVPKVSSDAPDFILDVMHNSAKEAIHSRILNEGDVDGLDTDAIQVLLNRDEIAISEFESVLLAHRWCQKTGVPFDSLLHLFDFNALTPEQKAWVIGQSQVSKSTPALVMNALCSSEILHRDDLSYFHMDYPGVRWQRVYDSSQDRLGTFLDSVATNVEMFHRKLIVFRPDERLSIAVYIPKKLERDRDCLVDDQARLFAFPHSQGRERQSRLGLPTKMSYCLYFDSNMFQLFEGKRQNSWVFLTRPGSRDHEYGSIPSKGDRRRQKQFDIDRGLHFEICASIALDKFSKNLQSHIGRVNRSQISAAEIYVISNRDVASMRSLDLWLEYIDTTEKLPLFLQEPKPYVVPNLSEVVTDSDPPSVVEVLRKRNLSEFEEVGSSSEYIKIFELLLLSDDKAFLLECFKHLFENIDSLKVPLEHMLEIMTDFLKKAPFLSIAFGQILGTAGCEPKLYSLLQLSSLPILRAFILSTASMGSLVVQPFGHALSKLPAGSLSLGWLGNLLELVSLTVRSPDLALDILLGALEPEINRLLVDDTEVVRHTMRMLAGVAIDHIDEASGAGKRRDDLLDFALHPKQEDGYDVVEVLFRVDAPGGTPSISSHVRFTTASPPANSSLDRRYSVDALAIFSEQGRARFKCLHPLPPYFRDCSWTIQDCGPFVTSKAMLDAVLNLAVSLDTCCGVAESILGVSLAGPPVAPTAGRNWRPVEKLNSSQNAAIHTALSSDLVCLWGPPGTGKTETIVEMICALQECYEHARVLVTAPTHNAVDNVMRRYMQRIKDSQLSRSRHQPEVLRVSTEVRKVAEDLRKYTCDAMAGQEIYSNRQAMEKATQAVERSDIVFTTCIGAGIGLLRSQYFDIAIVDEASQQTEPASLVPLVKGCTKAILVGDHVQLRPSVSQYALALDFDISLFERLYTAAKASASEERRVADKTRCLMLDTQYRMHPDICAFSSEEFYEGRLKTGIEAGARPLGSCRFPFPPASTQASPGALPEERSRALFIECSETEEPGHKSKENRGQAALCAHVCDLLVAPGEAVPGSTTTDNARHHSIAVLTPYNRQAELLRQNLSRIPTNIEVSSIDGFQGREAEIVVFVTVRCNEHRQIGFLKDLRRMNVALTRARTALIVIGNRDTLTKGDPEEASTTMWKRLLGRLTEVHIKVPVTS